MPPAYRSASPKPQRGAKPRAVCFIIQLIEEVVMSEELVNTATRLMAEQAVDFARLEVASKTFVSSPGHRHISNDRLANPRRRR